MKILVTGAFGNVGESTLEYLVQNKNYEITAFDLRNWANWRVSRRFRKKITILWGDLRNRQKIFRAVKGQDLVMHIGAVIPPKANRNKEYTQEVNFGGTKNIVDAITDQSNRPKLIYTSSVAIYGDVRNNDSPLISETDPPNVSPGDFYGEAKLKAEKYVRNADIDWVVFRLSYIPNSKKIKLTPLMFRMPLDTPIEITHTKDCGKALVNAIEREDIWGKIYNLGGGKECQIYYREFLDKMLPLMGVKRLPDEAFGNEPFHCCFYDTKALNEKLQFQKHTLEDLFQEMANNAKGKRMLAKIFRPFVRPLLLLLSPYYRKNKKRLKRKKRDEK
jgi:nucleoside-diphosphate-sugar epimerase